MTQSSDLLYFNFRDFRDPKWERAFRLRLGEDRYEIVPGSDAPDLRFAVEFPFMGEGARDFDLALENARKLGATRLENGTCCYPYPNRSRTRVAGVEWTGKVPGFMSPAFPTEGNYLFHIWLNPSGVELLSLQGSFQGYTPLEMLMNYGWLTDDIWVAQICDRSGARLFACRFPPVPGAK